MNKNLKFYAKAIAIIAILFSTLLPSFALLCARQPCTHLFYGLSVKPLSEVFLSIGTFGIVGVFCAIPILVLIFRVKTEKVCVLLIIASLITLLSHWLVWSPYFSQGDKLIQVEGISAILWFMVWVGQLLFNLLVLLIAYFLNRKSIM